ncbi:MAG: DUF4388 domain-containing protein [Candidatus Edwardsbacteria bacterium]
MALEGNLKDFSLAEILQLLSSQQKSGVLILTREKETVAFGFEQGQLVGAFHRHRGRREQLRTYFEKMGIISEEKLKLAEDVHQESGIPLEEILVQQGYLTEGELREVIAFKIQEIMDEVFTWADGQYIFETDSTLYAKSKFKVRFQTEAFLLEGMRRRDEWLRMEEIIPSLDVIFRKKSSPSESIQLSRDQEKIFSLLSERKTVSELIEISGLGKFTTAQVLGELLETELVEKIETTPVPVTEMAKRETVSFDLFEIVERLIKSLGLTMCHLFFYPFNHPLIMTPIEDFFSAFERLPMGLEGFTLGIIGNKIIAQGNPLSRQSNLISEFALYLSERQIKTLTFLSRLTRDELLNFTYLLDLKPSFIRQKGGIAHLLRSERLVHIRATESVPSEQISPFKDEKVFFIPTRFFKVLETTDTVISRDKEPLDFTSLLEKIDGIKISLSVSGIEEETTLKNTEEICNKIFELYSRSGRQTYVEKVTTLLLSLEPGLRFALLKKKILDPKWLEIINKFV